MAIWVCSMTVDLKDLLDLRPEAISDSPLTFQFLPNPLGQPQVTDSALLPCAHLLITGQHM